MAGIKKREKKRSTNEISSRQPGYRSFQYTQFQYMHVFFVSFGLRMSELIREAGLIDVYREETNPPAVSIILGACLPL